MTLNTWMLAYLKSGVSLSAVAGLYLILTHTSLQNPRFWNRLGIILLAFSLLAPLTFTRKVVGPLFPKAQVWAPSKHENSPRISIPIANRQKSSPSNTFAPPDWIFAGVVVLCLLLSFVTSLRWARELVRLSRWIHSTIEIRRLGSISIRVSSDLPSAFTCRFISTYIVFPESDWVDTSKRRMTFQHESEHVRSGDTSSAYLFSLLHLLFPWSPTLKKCIERLNEFQELACDEIAVGRRRVSSHAYARHLLEVAKKAVPPSPNTVGTTAMGLGCAGNQLKRRIEMILELKKKKPGYLQLIIAALCVPVVVFAIGNSIEDKRIAMPDAIKLVEGLREEVVVPIDLNALVLERLNRFVATPEGRKRVRDGLVRMPQYRNMIERTFGDRKLPLELLAIALFESNFRNDAVSPAPFFAKGIWQFIAPTARRYDLVVNETRDERLDPAKETVAAARYLNDLFIQFQDWRLAIKAYNEGEYQVQRLINEHETRDPWKLEEISTTEGYLPGAIAMIIILKNPNLVD